MIENKVKTENLQMIDIMKFISAMLVITIHSNPLTGICGYVLGGIIARIAVPFFFISSGYILYTKLKEDTTYIKNYVKRLTVLYTVWYGIYLVWRIVFEFNEFKVKDLILLIREYLFSGYYQLWYLPSLIISSLFIYLFIKRDKVRYLVFISIILLLVCIVGDSYSGIVNIKLVNKFISLYEIIFGTTKVGICFAVPFLTIGILIKKYNVNINKKILNIILMIAGIMFFSEGIILKYNNINTARNIYFTSVLIVTIVFIRLLKSDKVIKYSTSKLLRSLSLGIYCSHALFIMIFNKIYTTDKLEGFYIIRFLFVSISSIIFSYFLYKHKDSILKVLM